MFRKVLIANRGEIAVRVIRTCRDLGIAPVAVYSEPDRGALHVRLADEAYAIGPAPSRESYLRVDRIVEAAKRSGADAVHPGYGFMSENPAFAEACAAAGVVFIGPPPPAMRALGEKTAARRLAQEAGVPIVPGTVEPASDLEALGKGANVVGYPIVLKAAAGGGGKGMRIVRAPAELEVAFRGATGEAQNAFGDPALYVERFVEGARHVEVQFLADAHGSVVWLGERDCSIQRRHQKLLEETPGPAVDDALRERIGDAAVHLARAAGYVNAGTAEFLVDAEGRFYFLEVNARLQVEHPVTEMVTGLDLVALQLRVAAGEPLPFDQARVERRGAAIECRLYAEDPAREFAPSAGTVAFVREPAGPGVRVDSAVYAGMVVPTEYDPLLAKVIAHGSDRAEALARMRRALRETALAGVRTVLPFHQFVLEEPDFVAGRYDTAYVGTHWRPRGEATAEAALAATMAALAQQRRRSITPSVSLRSPGGSPGTPDGVAVPASGWKRAAREESLR